MARQADKWRLPPGRLLLPAPAAIARRPEGRPEGRFEGRDTRYEAAPSSPQNRIGTAGEDVGSTTTRLGSSHHLLWLAFYLPHLMLEVFGPTAEPLAVSDGPENRPVVGARNRAAAAAGVLPGMGVTTARALCRGLQVRRRGREAEVAALEALALWARQFTSLVHVRPEGLLLEVGGSLRLFGGLELLRRRVADGLADQGYRGRLAATPTPLGSWLLARNGRTPMLTTRDELEAVLRRLPLAGLELEPEQYQALHGMGLRTVGDCLRLPRGGLAKRLGPEFVLHLDRAFGRLPDPRPAFEPPATFHSRLPLPAEVDNAEALLFAGRRLVLQLAGFLHAQGSGIQEAALTLEHRYRADSVLTLGLARPSRDPDHLLALLRERLDRFELPAPVDGIALAAERLLPLESEHHDMFTPEGAERRDDWHLLADKLSARLGADAVTGLRPCPDHRPEKAWRTCPPDAPRGSAAAPRRPLWLLPEPRPLSSRDDTPWLGGPLHVGGEPERIESGWWDGEDAARDYFVAEDARGERLWVFRERRSGRWFLQGFFG